MSQGSHVARGLLLPRTASHGKLVSGDGPDKERIQKPL